MSLKVEPRYDSHDVTPPTHSADVPDSSSASLALMARQSAFSSQDRGMSVSASNIALAGQSSGILSLSAVQTSDDSSFTGQTTGQIENATLREQATLTEMSEAEKLSLKRKLADGTASLEEAERSASGRSDQYDGDVQLAYDATRPFDPTAVPNGQLRQVAAANLADDGLIEVLAADVNTVATRGEAIDQAAANRQIVMEPAVAMYQAFEIVVDGDSQASDAAADVARLAVAMNAQPVVQAE
jgi:hypothetical protein